MAQSVQIKKVSWWMERLCDYMIANPHADLQDIAKALEKSPSWISIVKNSDIFQDYWRTRSAIHSEQVTQVIKSKAFAAGELALDEINRKLELSAESHTTDQLLAIVDVTQKRFGYGDQAHRAPQLNVSLGLVTPEQLAEARQRLRKTDGPEMIELQPTTQTVGQPGVLDLEPAQSEKTE